MEKESSFITRVEFGAMVTHRMFREIRPSVEGCDFGTLMLHQGSEFNPEEDTITLQVHRSRRIRANRLIRSGGGLRVESRILGLKPGRLIKFGSDPHGFDIENLEPVGQALTNPLPIIDSSVFADAKAQHGLGRIADQIARFKSARSGKPTEESTVVSDFARDLGNGLWAYQSPEGDWCVVSADPALQEVTGLASFQEAAEMAQAIAAS